MPETVSRDIHPCECGKVVAWLPSPTGQSQPYEIKRDIVTEPDGARTVAVSTEDAHRCQLYSSLADFVQKAIDRRRAQEIRIRLPTPEPVALSWSLGDAEVDVSDGRVGKHRRSYGSINLKTGRYRPRQPLIGVDDILRSINRDPSHYDWSAGRSQTYCSFCQRPLNDPRSVRWGYGPVCADNYGLPWE